MTKVKSQQLIYQGATETCLPKYKFAKEFNVTYSKNHWSNLEKLADLFEKIISPYLGAKKIEFDIRKNKFHLSLWTPLRTKTTKRLNLYAWKTIASKS